jgi:hypothetical protein
LVWAHPRPVITLGPARAFPVPRIMVWRNRLGAACPGGEVRVAGTVDSMLWRGAPSSAWQGPSWWVGGGWWNPCMGLLMPWLAVRRVYRVPSRPDNAPSGRFRGDARPPTGIAGGTAAPWWRAKTRLRGYKVACRPEMQRPAVCLGTSTPNTHHAGYQGTPHTEHSPSGNTWRGHSNGGSRRMPRPAQRAPRVRHPRGRMGMARQDGTKPRGALKRA